MNNMKLKYVFLSYYEEMQSNILMNLKKIYYFIMGMKFDGLG